MVAYLAKKRPSHRAWKGSRWRRMAAVDLPVGRSSSAAWTSAVGAALVQRDWWPPLWMPLLGEAAHTAVAEVGVWRWRTEEDGTMAAGVHRRW